MALGRQRFSQHSRRHLTRQDPAMHAGAAGPVLCSPMARMETTSGLSDFSGLRADCCRSSGAGWDARLAQEPGRRPTCA